MPHREGDRADKAELALSFTVPPGITRRRFLRQTALGAAALAGAGAAVAQKGSGPKKARSAASVGKGKAHRLGFVGVGTRGSSLLQSALKMDSATVVAIADTYTVYRDRALAWSEKQYKEVKGYTHFEDLLETEKLDALVIATPDHIHLPVALAALDRGLDVYCEKPVTLTLEQAKALRAAVRAKKAVFQTGTQLRSMPMYQKARDLYQAGTLGKLLLVQVNRHFADGVAGPREIPAEATVSNVDWPAFLRDTTPYAWSPERYFRWRQYLEYSNGYFGDLMLHHMDLCHFITGAGMPRKVQATGGIYHFDDGRSCPDTISALLEYPEKFHLNFTCTSGNGHYGIVERYLFTQGTIEVTDMGKMTIFREGFDEEVSSEGIQNEPHLQNFFDAIRSRGTTIAPIEAGFQGAVCAHMAMQSHLKDRALLWDATNETIQDCAG